MLVAGCQGRALEQARANASYDFVTLRQIHDLSRGREKPVSRAAVRAVAIAEPPATFKLQ